MKKIKKVSFIIPAFNAEQYIKQCVNNILSIPYDNIEIIIVNDGSTDQTMNILSKISDERVIVISQRNQGVSSARNTGIYHATGDYIAFVDVDDIVLSKKYGNFLRKIHFDQDFYMFAYQINKNGHIALAHLPIEPGQYGRETGKKLMLRLYDNAFSKNYKSHYFGGKVYQYLYSKKFLCENKIFFPLNVHFAEDCIFCFKCFKSVSQFKIYKNCLYQYVVFEDSASHRYREDLWNELKTSYKLACEIAGYEVNHRGEIYFFYAKEVLRRISELPNGVEKKSTSLNKIKEIVNDKEFNEAIKHIKYNNWTFSEKILLVALKKRQVKCIYIFLWLRYIIRHTIKTNQP